MVGLTVRLKVKLESCVFNQGDDSHLIVIPLFEVGIFLSLIFQHMFVVESWHEQRKILRTSEEHKTEFLLLLLSDRLSAMGEIQDHHYPPK